MVLMDTSSSSSTTATATTPASLQHFPTYSYVYSNGSTPLSPLPKQLFMPPPEPYHIHNPIPLTHPPPPAFAPQPPQQSIPEPEPIPISSPSPPPQSRAQNPKVEFAIWSRRPQDPSQAPGVVISVYARPSQDIFQQALDLPTPPMSPIFLAEEMEPGLSPSSTETKPEQDNVQPEPESTAAPITEPEQALVPEVDAETERASETDAIASSTVPSSCVTEATDLGTRAPVSPATSATSLSASIENVSKLVTSSSQSQASPSVIPSIPLPPSEPVPTPTPAAPAPKKSWASLLQSSSSAAPTPGQKRLLTSSVVGISIPGSEQQQLPLQAPTSIQASNSQSSFAHPALSLPHTKRTELLHLLTSAPENGPTPPVIQPRGLINSGNMCFANSVFQVLLFCPPFHRLFTELGRYGFGFRGAAGTGTDREIKGPTPLVDSMVEFVREFSPAPAPRKMQRVTSGKGKGKEKAADSPYGHNEETSDWETAFLPSYVYDAMKEKTVFDGMRSGQQEDAEEFLGFFLDALEEELQAVVHALTAPPPPPVKKSKAKAKKADSGVEEKEEEEEREDGWMEVGKRNRTVITRTIKAIETPITRIFGGKVRSTLKSPGQKDSTTIEAWRALRLDIQTDSIHTLQDALTHMAAPQSLELDSSRHASIQHLLEALPPVLVVHLKRFCYDKDVGGVVKVGKAVQWGEELEVGGEVMAPALRKAPAARYKLFGALYHHGLSASGGHYTLDVLHPGRNATEGWMRIDDELVSDVRLEDVFDGHHEVDHKSAYLLFYRRIR